NKAGLGLRLVTNKPKEPPRVAGVLPDDSMAAGEYKTTVEAAEETRCFGKPTIILLHRVIDGAHTGVALYQYIRLKKIGKRLAPDNKPYLSQVEIALGRPLDILSGESAEPEPIFVGKVFNVAVRWRAASQKGQPEDSSRRKDESDTLRVGSIVALCEL